MDGWGGEELRLERKNKIAKGEFGVSRRQREEGEEWEEEMGLGLG